MSEKKVISEIIVTVIILDDKNNKIRMEDVNWNTDDNDDDDNVKRLPIESLPESQIEDAITYLLNYVNVLKSNLPYPSEDNLKKNEKDK